MAVVFAGTLSTPPVSSFFLPLLLGKETEINHWIILSFSINGGLSASTLLKILLSSCYC